MLGVRLAIEQEVLEGIISGLANRGYRVVGPTVRDGAIIYEPVARLEDLLSDGPINKTPGVTGSSGAPTRRSLAMLSSGRFLHPPVERLWQVRREGDGFSIVEKDEMSEPLAFIGVRACELRAIGIHDRVFLAGPFLDSPTKFAASTPSSSLSIAVRRAAPASAPRWMWGPRSRRVSTWP